MPNYIVRSFADIFKEIDPSTMQVKNKITVPNDFYQRLLDYVLERGYLCEVGGRRHFPDFIQICERKLLDCKTEEERTRLKKLFEKSGVSTPRNTWMKVNRLHIHPNDMKEYDLLSRWQGVLATLHTWGHRLVFILQRKNGETGLYLGTASLSREISSARAVEQFN